MGQKKGMGSLHLHVADFFRDLLKKKIGENGYPYLIDKRGVIVAHKDQSRLGVDVSDFQSTKNVLAGDSRAITETDEGHRVLMKKGYVPLNIEGLSLVVVQPMNEISAFGKQHKLFNLIFLIVTILLISTISYSITKKLINPIKKLTDVIGDIHRMRRLDVEIDPALIESKDEVGQLATAFEEMRLELKEAYEGLETKVEERTKQLKEATEKLIQSEKMAAAAQIAAEAAHEIRSPLNVIKTGLYYIKRVLPKEKEKVQRKLIQMDDAAERASSYVTNLVSFSNPPMLNLAAVEANEVLEKSLEELPSEIITDIEIEKNLCPGLPQIEADPERLKQVFSNLIKNAAESMGESGRLKLSIKKENGTVEVEIADSGSGINEENLPKLFDPFFTTKGKGTGLGLAICHRIIEAHKGAIKVRSKVGQGSTFTIQLSAKI